MAIQLKADYFHAAGWLENSIGCCLSPTYGKAHLSSFFFRSRNVWIEKRDQKASRHCPDAEIPAKKPQPRIQIRRISCSGGKNQAAKSSLLSPIAAAASTTTASWLVERALTYAISINNNANNALLYYYVLVPSRRSQRPTSCSIEDEFITNQPASHPRDRTCTHSPTSCCTNALLLRRGFQSSQTPKLSVH